jgi:S-adenosylmethionine decarboxylase
MGDHYLLNLYGCSFVLLDDEKYLIDLLENAAVASGATVVQTISKKFEPQGCTVLTLLSESHFSIHTWPEKGKAAVDCYTCGDCNPKIGCDIIIHQLYATEHKLDYIKR